MSLDEEREIAREVPRIVEALRLRVGRRLIHSPRGGVYLRSVFRANASRGGVPFELPRRRRRLRRPKIVLLLDVSWSTARATGLFLCLAAGFLRRLPRTKLFLFVDRAVAAGRELEDWLAEDKAAGAPSGRERAPGHVPTERRPAAGVERGGRSFAEMLDRVPGLDRDAPSDYGRTFHGLLHARSAATGRDTVWLILGDGRTNRFDPQSWAFEELARRSGAVIWLVPEARSLWCGGDSALAEYLPHADTVVEARDLDGLARGVAALLRGIAR